MKTPSPYRRAASFISLVLVLVFAFANQSCHDDLESKTGPEKSSVSKAPAMQDKMISYDQFLKQIKGFEDKELYNHFKSNAAAAHRTNQDSPFPIRILPSTTDSIRKISINNHTTYTIPVYRRSHTGEVFRNIIIDSSATGVKAMLAWYFPDKNWIKEYKRNPKRSFYGSVIMTDYDLPSGIRSGGRTNLVPVCISVMVLSEITEHLCCHNMQHGLCGCPSGSQYYIDYSYITQTTCIEGYIPSSGGFPGGGSGGGDGGTVPNPGGGYDPCTGNGLRTLTNPCNPPTPNPGPVVAPNANVAPLVSIAMSKGLNFNSLEVAMLNSLGLIPLNRIKDLVSKFGSMVRDDYSNLITVLTGENMQNLESGMLNALGDGLAESVFMVRLIYAANAYAAQNYTAVKYNICGSTCPTCKANAFKHALFLIFNAELFTLKAATALAAAHEDGQAGKDAQMDKINNAAGQKIYEQFSGNGTPIQWVDRVKASTDNAQFGMVFVKSNALVSTKTVDVSCP